MTENRIIQILAISILLGALTIFGFACSTATPQPETGEVTAVIVARPDKLTFVVNPAQSTTADQNISVTNAGSGVLTWSMADNTHWIYLQQPEGAPVTNNIIKVRVDTAGMAAGDYTGIITIAAEGAANSPVYVPVNLSVLPATVQAPVVTPQPATSLPGTVQPGSSAVVWKNHNELMNYATTNACIESGSITNTDKLWFMRDVKIVAKSGSSVDIASVIPPGETVIYNKFIPCFERQEVNLLYKWQLQ
ncbi:MAG: hypothetical protein PHO26_04570 [Dehalococcoidia bacterium]|nr:hypothetical protein [Dehalococcoidia bacterium]MDD5494642.1 hypothetical protein [Dehalococcoidia bacterium]